jgi:hypothetical protein
MIQVLTCTACYRDIFAFLFVDDIHTSQETRLGASSACYVDSIFLVLFSCRMNTKSKLGRSHNWHAFFERLLLIK